MDQEKNEEIIWKPFKKKKHKHTRKTVKIKKRMLLLLFLNKIFSS